MRVKVMGIWYCTREDVKSALDFNETARNNSQVDRAIEAASRSVEKLTHRKFYPWTGTRYFNYPLDSFGPPSWKLWLGQDELVSLTSLTSGGTAIDVSDTFLEPNDSGPPFTSLELDRASSASFGSGSTPQRDIAITGVFGHSADESPAGTLAAAIVSTSATTITVSDSSIIGVGDLIRVDSERMIVTGKSLLTTSQTTSIDNNKATVTVPVATGSAYNVGEVLTIDAERVQIQDIAGNNLIVKRAVDGSVLATHSTATIYAPRTLTVTRGAVGTTAATHLISASINKHVPPGPVRALTIAEAISQIQQEASGYGRVVGSGDSQREASGVGLVSTRQEVYRNFARRLRIGAV